ncbi:hypothetical protein R3P38DRAFT_2804653 [Favolaschia claudopus]|uniref:Uncharacterized protein n=1 Tax=Favolaschia claudopus TaxID=2862362 RepID=A0AAV9ZQC6_9AGAR
MTASGWTSHHLHDLFRGCQGGYLEREAQKTIAHEEPPIATGGYRKVSIVLSAECLQKHSVSQLKRAQLVSAADEFQLDNTGSVIELRKRIKAHIEANLHALSGKLAPTTVPLPLLRED